MLYSYHQRIPKAERYTLWQKCENTIFSLLESLIETSHYSGEKRIQSLYPMSNKLDLLKALIRLAKETRTLDNPQYV